MLRTPLDTTLPLGVLILGTLCACNSAAPVRPAPLGATLHVVEGTARSVDREQPTSVAPLEPLTPFEAAPMQDAPPAAPPPAQEYYDNIYHRFGLSLGGALYGNFDTSIQISSAILVGAILDLEDLLRVDSNATIGRIDAHYSFNRRHRIDLAYYDIGRNGSANVLQDIPIGEAILPAGVINTTFDTKILKLAYRYNFVHDYRTTIGASIGLHTMQIDTALVATGINVEESFDALAPLPLLGLHGAYAISKKWRLTAGFEALYVDFSGFDGFVLDTRLSLDHDTFKHFGWGIGFNSFTLNIGIDGKDDVLRAEIEYGYTGLLLYVRTFF